MGAGEAGRPRPRFPGGGANHDHPRRDPYPNPRRVSGSGGRRARHDGDGRSLRGQGGRRGLPGEEPHRAPPDGVRVPPGRPGRRAPRPLPQDPHAGRVKPEEPDMSRQVMEEIRREVEENPVLIYMKGTKEMPQCGFSAAALQVLGSYGVPFKDVNVLDDQEKWAAVKV